MSQSEMEQLKARPREDFPGTYIVLVPQIFDRLDKLNLSLDEKESLLTDLINL